MLKKIVIWGASGHALIVADIIQRSGKYKIVGFLDDINLDRRGSTFHESKILGGKEQLIKLRGDEGVSSIVLAIGDCHARQSLAAEARIYGFELVTVTHPSSIVASDVVIGPGSVICAGAVINPGTYIGENVIINTGATIDHECVIGDGAHIGPGVHLGGLVKIGKEVWVGIGAVLVDRINIGAGSIIGAGSLVLKDIDSKVVAYGSPAKIIKSIDEGTS